MTDAQHTTKGGFTGPLLMAAVVSAVSALLYGYDTGIISEITARFLAFCLVIAGAAVMPAPMRAAPDAG